MWPRSLFISVLSACLAVWATLQYQAWVDRRRVTPPVPADECGIHEIEQENSRSQRVALCSTPDQVDGEPTESVDTVEEVVDASHGTLGADLIAVGDMDEAIRVLESGTLDPYSAYNLGVAWQSKGETDKAIAAYAQAIELEPTLTEPRVNLGAQLLKIGRLRDAEAVLLTAVNLGGDAGSLAAAHYNLGALLKRSGRLEEALEAYAQGVRWGAARSSLMRIAELHLEMGHPHQALEASRRALLEDGDPRDASPLLQAGLILESLEEVEEAAEYFAKVTKLDPENLEATIHLGYCQQRLGQHHEALGSFLIASRLEPEDPATYELLHSAVDEAKGAHIDGESDRSDGSNKPRVEALAARCGVSRTNDSEASAKQLHRIQGVASINDSVDSVMERDYSDPDPKSTTAVDFLYFNADGMAAATKTVDLLAVSGSEGKTEGRENEDTDAAEHAAGRCVESSLGFEHHGESMCDVPERGLSGASILIAAADTSRQLKSLSEHDAASVLKPEDLLLPESEHGPEGGRDVRVNSSGEEKRVVESVTFVDRVSSPEGDFRDGEVVATAVADSGNVDGGLTETAQQVSGPEGADLHVGDAHELSWSVDMDKERAKEVTVEESLQTVEIEEVQSVYSEAPLIASSGEKFSVEGVSNEDLEPSMSTSLAVEKDENEDAVSPGENELSTPRRASGSASPVKEKYGGTLEIRVEDDLMLSANKLEPEDFFVGEAVPAMELVADAEYSEEFSLSEDIDPPKGLAYVEAARVEGQEVADTGISYSTEEEERVSADAVVQKDGAKSDDISLLDVTPEEAVVMESMGSMMTGDAHEMVGEEGDVVTAETKGWASPKTEEGEGIEVRMNDTGVGPEDEIAPREDLESEAAAETQEASQGQTEDADSTLLGAPSLSDSAKTFNELVERLSEQDQAQRSANDSNSIPDAAGLGGTEGWESEFSPSASGSTGSGGRSTGDVDAPPTVVSQAPRDAEAADSLSATTGKDLVGPSSPKSDGEVVGVGQEEHTPEDGAARVDNGGSSATAVGDDKVGTATGGTEDVGGSVRAEGSKAQGSVGTVSVPEEEARRARSKAKLGLARLQQGQTKKALNLFQNVASIDPEWWGGFYYTALAQYELGNVEAAAKALTSALQVPAPSEAEEMAELRALVSKVLTSIARDKGSTAEQLKTAMDASELDFNAVELTLDSPGVPPVRPSAARDGTIGTAAVEGLGSGRREDNVHGFGSRAASMGSIGSSRAGVEADLASGSGDAVTESAGPLETNRGPDRGNKNSRRWPFSRKGGSQDRSSAAESSPQVGGPGTMLGGDRGTAPEVEGMEQSRAGSTGVGSGGRRRFGGSELGKTAESELSRDSSSGKEETVPVPDVPPKKRWGWGLGREGQDARAGSSAEVFHDRSHNSPGGRAAPVGIGNTGGGGSVVVDPNASAEDILASMGLKTRVSLEPGELNGFAPGSKGASTEGSMTGGSDGDGVKRGVLSRIWRRGKQER